MRGGPMDFMRLPGRLRKAARETGEAGQLSGRILQQLFGLLLVPACLVALVLYRGVLHSFFVFDQLSCLRIAWVDARGWVSCVETMRNGFWRPLWLLSARA